MSVLTVALSSSSSKEDEHCTPILCPNEAEGQNIVVDILENDLNILINNKKLIMDCIEETNCSINYKYFKNENILFLKHTNIEVVKNGDNLDKCLNKTAEISLTRSFPLATGPDLITSSQHGVLSHTNEISYSCNEMDLGRKINNHHATEIVIGDLTDSLENPNLKSFINDLTCTSSFESNESGTVYYSECLSTAVAPYTSQYNLHTNTLSKDNDNQQEIVISKPRCVNLITSSTQTDDNYISAYIISDQLKIANSLLILYKLAIKLTEREIYLNKIQVDEIVKKCYHNVLNKSI